MSILNVNKINPVGGGSTVTIAGIASVTGSVSATTFQGDGAQLTGLIPGITPEKFGAIAKPVIEPETRTWYNAMSTKPKREHLRSMDMLVKRLKWSGIWTELDTLYAFASHNKADSLINVKNPGTANLTETSTATFTAGKGFTAGSSGRLATSVNFNTFAVKYTANNAHIGVFMLTEGVRDNSPIAGVNDGLEDVYIVPLRSSTDQLRGRISTSSGSDFTNTKSSGSFILSRTGAQIIAYRNGFELGHDVKNSEGVPSDKLEVLLVTSSDGGGLISFLHTGDKLDGSKSRAFAWIMQEYINEVEQGYDEGNTVTVSQLDASVDLSTNTTAMQNFLNAAVGKTLGVLGDETYLVNDKLSIPDSPNIQGVIGKSTIKADSTMSNVKPLMVQGSKDNQSFGGRIDGLILDYNVDRTIGTGGLNEDTDGNAFSLHNVQGGRYTNITAMSAYKHGFDILGNTYNRSGTASSFNQRHNLTSRDIYVDNIIAMGNGDDGFSTHGAEYITGGYVWGEFARASYSSGSNSNAIEIDDFSRYINIEDAGGRFAHRAVEIKGHDDALPAEHIHIGRVFSEHCAMGLTIRHLGHDSSTISPGAGDIRIEEVYVRAPVDWSLGTGISQAQAGLVYAYDRVSIGNFIGRNEGAVGVVTTQVLQVINGANNFNADRVDVVGFSSALEAIDMSGITTGTAMYGSVRIDNSATDKAFEISDGVDVVLSSFSINKSGTAGNTGIYIHAGHAGLGTGFVTGYSTPINTNVS